MAKPTLKNDATRNDTERFEASLTDDGRYRLLVEGITDYAIYLLDPHGTISSWNAGAERFKGYTAAEIVGQHFSKFYLEQDRASGLPERALRTAATEGKFESEGWRVRKDGTQFWAYVVIDPIYTPTGELIGYAKITRDLTERRRIEQTLRSSEEQFRLLVQGVTDYAIYMLTPTGEIASWNPGAERIKGYSADEVIGTHFSRFYTPEDQAGNVPAAALETARRVGRYEKEGQRVRKDGTVFWANVVIDAVQAPNGELIGFAKITRDITEQYEARKSLQQAQEALLHSQKIDAIGQLTGGVAHDFNNLLTVIMGSLELIKKRTTDKQILPLVENASVGAKRGTALIQRMLAFARRQELKIDSIDLTALTAEMAELLQRTMTDVTSLHIHIRSSLPRVRCDANQLELALLNLVVNARDAMPNGGAIALTGEEQQVLENAPLGLVPGRYVCLKVEDTGEGMDEATLSRAIEPFFTTKGIGKGTGLGLPMVHGFAMQCGGMLKLESTLGVGTTAYLWLPIATTEPMEVAAKIESGLATHPAKLIILVVDDDALVLQNTTFLLEDMGHHVLAVASGADAVTVFNSRPDIGLIITDHAMPNMTGAELTKALRLKVPALPIIIATGYAESLESMPDGSIRLAKPFDQVDLMEALNRAMRR